MPKILCVFPNDSLLSYYEKGEIKNRYFNPKNWFDEVHIISLFDEEVDEEKVKILAGDAVFKIHKVRKVNLSNYKALEDKITTLVQGIKPSVIRSFNPLIQGWLATRIAKKLTIPIMVSLHTNYEQQRELARKEGKYLQYLKLKFTSRNLESYVLKNADAVICAYEFIVPYAKKMGARNIQVIYNKVDLDKFSPQCKKELYFDRPTIISVGRLIKQKNHRYLIEAIKNLNVNLLIIGDGPNYESLVGLAESLGISKKVQMIKSVPHDKLNAYYASCDIYAQPMELLGGITIPILEAMASGLPVIMSKREGNYSEIIDNAVVFVENDAASFENAINSILLNTQLREDLKKKSLETIKKISGDNMEEKELKFYKEILGTRFDN